MAEHRLRELPASFLKVETKDEAETRSFAEDIAMILKAGDVVCLSGDLGAGKSTFARALIRTLADDDLLDVPSPTFTLVQSYELPRFDLAHLDLYRLEEPEEIEELGLPDLLQSGAALIEWPEMAEDLLPQDALWIQISQPDDDDHDEGRRRFDLYAQQQAWRDRIGQTRDTRAFLQGAGFTGVARRFLAGDASLRTFESIAGVDGKRVLMRWPFREGGVPESVRTYMKSVHLAEDCRAVLAIGMELRKRGIRAPETIAADPEKGLVLLEDLGRDTIVVGGKPDPERYEAAVEVLARMHSQTWPGTVALPEGGRYVLQPYSDKALIAEASLFLDWYVPEVGQTPVDAAMRTDFEALWQQSLDGIADAQRGWVLRDFHSPNLLWQEGASGTDRIGLIDLQDTVIGPVAYDVASLLLDARTDIGTDLETRLYDAYVGKMETLSPGFDRQSFSRAYSVMAAQRITKILGIFVRLARRDSKPSYLSHLPRMIGYLDRVFERPGMSDLKDWYGQFRH
ncbi:tRNA (adenosine(37)-N6)-threonylcarbamoyltransferase complex ATPase subunit type 1 TsaE [Roseibium sp. MMSF_3412]|uniref:tRNA (adenosine(37)-N6)-threonylcarbamoyltransferase complex ATPase subunit type 1 TsaE n=1 Tax=Roseibium sp. MMSF_3412 TaxID=3046712 RepID=UPI00273E5F10|nr:tRNA (adenosine(37)-N6)-threonylcarbamoyltransferase complex ATPase subunit type 1 TsaE [Roseibium sp. MMSF_3412]